jgi:hypothetical protein
MRVKNRKGCDLREVKCLIDPRNAMTGDRYMSQLPLYMARG